MLADTELSDLLVEKDCLSEAECFDLRRITTSKDQVRNLVRIIKGRSFNVLISFLKCIKKTNPDVERVIKKSFHKMVESGKHRKDECTFCCLKNSVDIKMLADYLWADSHISDKLYDQIVRDNSDIDALWRHISLENNQRRGCDNLTLAIARVLRLKGKYQELVYKLSKERQLVCSCNDPASLESRQTFVSLLSFCDEYSTVSPRSSTFSVVSQQDIIDTLPFGVEETEQNVHRNLFLSEKNTWRHEDPVSKFRSRSNSLFPKHMTNVLSKRRGSAII